MIFDDTVYKCSLHSIAPDIRVNHDWSKKENIMGAKTIIIGEIMVQRTLNPNVYREIVTGTLIPVYRTTTKFGLCYASRGDRYYKVPKKSVFIKINDRYAFGDYTSSLKVAPLEEVQNYIERFSGDIEGFKYQLNSLFERAEAYYEKASAKNDVSDRAKIKTLVKSIGKK